MHWCTIASFAFVGLLFVALSIPLILRRVPPNRLYGFRLRKTLSDPAIWYKANEYAGKLLAIAGAVISLASVALGILGLSDEVYAISMVVVLTVSTGTALIASLIYLRRL